MYGEKREDDHFQSGLKYPVVNLMIALFRITAQDLRYGNDNFKQEANEFLDSEWFIVICDAMNLEYNEVRRLIKRGKPRNRRSYEEI
jgi:hypothetical protein